MAALLTAVNLARSLRERAHALTDLLPRSLAQPLLLPEREIAALLDDLGLNQPAPERQAEAVIAALYAQVEAMEARLVDAGLLTAIRRRAVAVVRDTVVDLELLLLPKRERDCELLGVTREDDITVVKSKFRALARQHHPDVPGGNSKRMEELNRVYKIALRMRRAR